jgi:hypothetical protein
MARAIAQLLRIHDGTVDYQLFQNHWREPIFYGGKQWRFVPFQASAIVAGLSGDEAGMTVDFAADGLNVPAVQWAIGQKRLVELTMLQFDSEGAGSPPAAAEVIGSFAGEATGATATLTRISMQVGSILAPIGSQIPPKTITPNLIGKGCIL